MLGDEDDGDDESAHSDNVDSGQLYDFVVAETNDRGENVIISQAGFTVRLPFCPLFQELAPILLSEDG